MDLDDMAKSKLPTANTILKRMREFKRLNRDAFLAKYAGGRKSKTAYLVLGGDRYDLKAIYAAAHVPPIDPVIFNTHRATAGVMVLQSGGNLKGLTIKATPTTMKSARRMAAGGNIETQKNSESSRRTKRRAKLPTSAVQQFFEGEKQLSVASKKVRSSKLVKAAKEFYDPNKCAACSFDFVQFYGKAGAGAIEVHHLDPVAMANPEIAVTLERLCLLCANCHRMVHRRQEVMTIEALIKLINRFGKTS